MQRLDRAPVISKAGIAVAQSSGEETPQQEAPAKPHHLLAISCTVYDNKLTLVRWHSANRSYSAFVNIDFNNLAGIGMAESEDAVYSVMLAVGNDTSESLNAANAELLAAGTPAASLIQLPADSAFPAGITSYVLTGPSPDAAQIDADCAGLETLLDHYDNNRQALIAARQQRETEQLQREQFLKANPPQPKGTVIKFWPVKSQRYQVVPQEDAP